MKSRGISFTYNDKRYKKITNKQIIEFSKSFRNGEIKENEIPKPHVDQLKELYRKQIELLENSIEDDRIKIKNEINM